MSTSAFRRLLPALLIGGLALTASCGGGDDDASATTEPSPSVTAATTSPTDPPTDPAPTTAPPPATDPDTTVAPASTEPTEPAATNDQAAAEASLLRLADFPEDWTEVPNPEQEYEGELAEARSRFIGCVGDEGVRLLDWAEARAHTGEFTSPEGDTVAQTVAVIDTAEADQFMRRFGAEGASECLTGAARDVIEAGLAQDPDSPEGLTIGDVTVERLEVAPAGDELIGYRATIPLALGGDEVDLFVDLVSVRVGRAISGLTIEASAIPFPSDALDRYVGLAAERMASAQAGG